MHPEDERDEEARTDEPEIGRLNATEEPLESLRKERDELLDKLQRVGADFQNYRRRMEARVDDLVRLKMESLFTDLITVIDGIDAALGSSPETEPDAKSLLEGFRQIYQQLLRILERHDLRRIPTEGETFDPRHHEVLLAEKTGEAPPDQILEELRPGYFLKDRVLRPAQVKVALSPAEES